MAIAYLEISGLGQFWVKTSPGKWSVTGQVGFGTEIWLFQKVTEEGIIEISVSKSYGRGNHRNSGFGMSGFINKESVGSICGQHEPFRSEAVFEHVGAVFHWIGCWSNLVPHRLATH